MVERFLAVSQGFDERDAHELVALQSSWLAYLVAASTAQVGPADHVVASRDFVGDPRLLGRVHQLPVAHEGITDDPGAVEVVASLLAASGPADGPRPG